MLAKLLSLLLHAKSGAISGVFLLGATGALVSVSASNGVTTVTITEASPATQAVTTEASKSPELSSPPVLLSKPLTAVTAATTGCTDQEKVSELQVHRVNTAFSGFHTDLMKLRHQRAEATIQTADALLKATRQSAVKAIHASVTCKTEDADENETDEDSDTGASTTSLDTDSEKDEHSDSDHHTKKPTVTFTVTDPKAIADQALAAMQAAFDTAKNAPATTTHSTHSTDQKKHDGKSDDHRSGHDD